MRRIVELFCEGLYPGDVAATRLQVAAGCQFLLELHGEWEINDDADQAAERVWSSLKRLPLVGAGGGLTGAFFNAANERLTRLRFRLAPPREKKKRKVRGGRGR